MLMFMNHWDCLVVRACFAFSCSLRTQSTSFAPSAEARNLARSKPSSSGSLVGDGVVVSGVEVEVSDEAVFKLTYVIPLL